MTQYYIIITRGLIFNHIGGLETYCNHLISALTNNKKKVLVFDGSGIFFFYSLKKRKIKKFSLTSFKYLNYLLLFYYQFYLLKFILKKKFNLILIGFIGFPITLLRKKFNRIYSSFFGLEILENINKKKIFRNFQNTLKLRKYLIQKIIDNSSHLILESKSDVNIYEKFNLNISTKILIILPDPVNVNNISFIKKKFKEILFIYVGRDSPEKNILKSIKFFSLINSKLKINLKYIICSPKFTNKYPTLVKNKNIILYENLNNEIIDKLRKKAHFFMNFSNQKVPLLSVLESCVYGVIPISENNMGNILNDDNSILIMNKNYSIVFSKIKNMISNTKIYDNYSYRTYLDVKTNFSLENFFKIVNENF